MQSEILQLYEQKEKREPEPLVKEFIQGLTVREVARIWSLMGDGEDFIEALKRVLALKIAKAVGDDAKKLEGGGSIEDMVKRLQEQKEQKKKEEEEIKQKVADAEKDKAKMEENLKREKEEAERARVQNEKAKLKEEEERKAAEVASQAKIEADKKATAAAEEERLLQEKAVAAAAEDRKAAEEAAAKAREELAELRRLAEEAEEARKAAEESAAKEKAELSRQEALREAAEQREKERVLEAAKLAKEQEEAAEKAKEIDEEARKEKEEQEEELKEEVITVKLEAADEALGLDCLAGAGRVRIIDATGACQRAGVKTGSVLLKVDGQEVTSQETLISAVKAMREAEKTEFDVVVQPPLMVSEEDKDILRRFQEQKEEIRKWKEMVEECKEVRVEMKVLQGLNMLDKSSTKPYCEVKLRECALDGKTWKVGSNHKNPQKGTTKQVSCQSNKKILTPAVWEEIFTFDAMKEDCIRVSIFGHKTLMKEYLGRVDLILPDLLEELCAGPIIGRWPIQGGNEGRGPVGGELELALNLLLCDGRDDPDAV